MATITKGYAPWEQGYKRVTKKTSANYEWNLHTGWRAKRYQDQWVHSPTHGKTKKVRLYNGKEVEVPDADYEDFIGYQKSTNPDDEIQAYITNALYSNKVVQEAEPAVDEVHGVGHILMLRYSATYQLLEAEFEGGATVVYFRVPKEAFSHLKSIAESGQTFVDIKGNTRHVLGKEFWDVIRIRGQRTGGRYRYAYQAMNTATEKVAKDPKAKRASSEATTDMTDKYDDIAYKMFSSNASKMTEYTKLDNDAARKAWLQKHGGL